MTDKSDSSADLAKQPVKQAGFGTEAFLAGTTAGALYLGDKKFNKGRGWQYLKNGARNGDGPGGFGLGRTDYLTAAQKRVAEQARLIKVENELKTIAKEIRGSDPIARFPQPRNDILSFGSSKNAHLTGRYVGLLRERDKLIKKGVKLPSASAGTAASNGSGVLSTLSLDDLKSQLAAIEKIKASTTDRAEISMLRDWQSQVHEELRGRGVPFKNGLPHFTEASALKEELASQTAERESLKTEKARLERTVKASSAAEESVVGHNLKMLDRPMSELLTSESRGGNAGAREINGRIYSSAGANGFIDPTTGRIEVFDNPQYVAPELKEGKIPITLEVSDYQRQILGHKIEGEISPKARAALEAAIERHNQLHINSPKAKGITDTLADLNSESASELEPTPESKAAHVGPERTAKIAQLENLRDELELAHRQRNAPLIRRSDFLAESVDKRIADLKGQISQLENDLGLVSEERPVTRVRSPSVDSNPTRVHKIPEGLGNGAAPAAALSEPVPKAPLGVSSSLSEVKGLHHGLDEIREKIRFVNGAIEVEELNNKGLLTRGSTDTLESFRSYLTELKSAENVFKDHLERIISGTDDPKVRSAAEQVMKQFFPTTSAPDEPKPQPSTSSSTARSDKITLTADDFKDPTKAKNGGITLESGGKRIVVTEADLGADGRVTITAEELKNDEFGRLWQQQHELRKNLSGLSGDARAQAIKEIDAITQRMVEISDELSSGGSVAGSEPTPEVTIKPKPEKTPGGNRGTGGGDVSQSTKTEPETEGPKRKPPAADRQASRGRATGGDQSGRVEPSRGEPKTEKPRVRPPKPAAEAGEPTSSSTSTSTRTEPKPARPKAVNPPPAGTTETAGATSSANGELSPAERTLLQKRLRDLRQERVTLKNQNGRVPSKKAIEQVDNKIAVVEEKLSLRPASATVAGEAAAAANGGSSILNKAGKTLRVGGRILGYGGLAAVTGLTVKDLVEHKYGSAAAGAGTITAVGALTKFIGGGPATIATALVTGVVAGDSVKNEVAELPNMKIITHPGRGHKGESLTITHESELTKKDLQTLLGNGYSVKAKTDEGTFYVSKDGKTRVITEAGKAENHFVGTNGHGYMVYQSKDGSYVTYNANTGKTEKIDKAAGTQLLNKLNNNIVNIGEKITYYDKKTGERLTGNIVQLSNGDVAVVQGNRRTGQLVSGAYVRGSAEKVSNWLKTRDLSGPAYTTTKNDTGVFTSKSDHKAKAAQIVHIKSGPNAGKFGVIQYGGDASNPYFTSKNKAKAEAWLQKRSTSRTSGPVTTTISSQAVYTNGQWVSANPRLPLSAADQAKAQALWDQTHGGQPTVSIAQKVTKKEPVQLGYNPLAQPPQRNNGHWVNQGNGTWVRISDKKFNGKYQQFETWHAPSAAALSPTTRTETVYTQAVKKNGTWIDAKTGKALSFSDATKAQGIYNQQNRPSAGAVVNLSKTVTIPGTDTPTASTPPTVVPQRQTIVTQPPAQPTSETASTPQPKVKPIITQGGKPPKGVKGEVDYVATNPKTGAKTYYMEDERVYSIGKNGKAYLAKPAPKPAANERVVDDWWRDKPSAAPAIQPTKAKPVLHDDWWRDKKLPDQVKLKPVPVIDDWWHDRKLPKPDKQTPATEHDESRAARLASQNAQQKAGQNRPAANPAAEHSTDLGNRTDNVYEHGRGRPSETPESSKTPPPAPYTGAGGAEWANQKGHSVVLKDGTRRTITETGAVIKTTKDGNSYREGWVDPDKIDSYDEVDLKNLGGKLKDAIKPGSTNPWVISSSGSTSSPNPNSPHLPPEDRPERQPGPTAAEAEHVPSDAEIAAHTQSVTPPAPAWHQDPGWGEVDKTDTGVKVAESTTGAKVLEVKESKHGNTIYRLDNGRYQLITPSGETRDAGYWDNTAWNESKYAKETGQYVPPPAQAASTDYNPAMQFDMDYAAQAAQGESGDTVAPSNTVEPTVVTPTVNTGPSAEELERQRLAENAAAAAAAAAYGHDDSWMYGGYVPPAPQADVQISGPTAPEATPQQDSHISQDNSVPDSSLGFDPLAAAEQHHHGHWEGWF